MILLPIEIDPSLNMQFGDYPECVEILNVYPDYYREVGFIKPWIGYFVSQDGTEIIGCGGFKGKPREGKVEIAYGTFKNYEGKGVGTEICRQLVIIAKKTDPSILITARTLIQYNGSTTILQRNGFVCRGIVYDEEDGNVWEWELPSAM